MVMCGLLGARRFSVVGGMADGGSSSGGVVDEAAGVDEYMMGEFYMLFLFHTAMRRSTALVIFCMRVFGDLFFWCNGSINQHFMHVAYIYKFSLIYYFFSQRK